MLSMELNNIDNRIRFNIAGAFAKASQLIMFFFKHKDILNRFNITVYDGTNSCQWNGGRINRDITYTDETIDFYYRHNISIALAFTNPVIDLNDEIGNHLLEKFHRDGNYIISVNEQLRQYIKTNFPEYKHTRSITAFGNINVPMKDEDVNTYRELEDKYDFIVPRSEHVFDERFKELSVSKYEIMLNDTCMYNCPHYGEHFKKIAEQNTLFKKPWIEGGHDEMFKIEECWLPHFDPGVGHVPTIKKYGENYGMDLTTRQINRLRKQGIYNFKITGREMVYEDFEVELNAYLKPVYD